MIQGGTTLNKDKRMASLDERLREYQKEKQLDNKKMKKELKRFMIKLPFYERSKIDKLLSPFQKSRNNDKDEKRKYWFHEKRKVLDKKLDILREEPAFLTSWLERLVNKWKEIDNSSFKLLVFSIVFSLVTTVLFGYTIAFSIVHIFDNNAILIAVVWIGAFIAGIATVFSKKLCGHV